MVNVVYDFTGFIYEITFLYTMENEHTYEFIEVRICNIIFHIRAKIFTYDNLDFIYENVSNYYTNSIFRIQITDIRILGWVLVTVTIFCPNQRKMVV